MIIYIDKEFKCYNENINQEFESFDVNFFDGKCKEFIEGYIYIPEGYSYKHTNGECYNGEMLFAWKDCDELDIAQRKYEQQQLEETNTQVTELLDTIAQMVDEVYQSDIEILGI